VSVDNREAVAVSIPEDMPNSDSESDDDDANKSRDESNVAPWARKGVLQEAISRQHLQGMDPDDIFPSMQRTCDLEEVFNERSTRMRKRTSSANWSRDHFTAAEEIEYKRAMGFRRK
jgi:hypothetical protein